MLGVRAHLRNFNQQELKLFLKQLQIPVFRVTQILHWLYQKNAMQFPELKNLPKDMLGLLSEKAYVRTLELVEVPQSSNHESSKYLMRTFDGHLLESVLIS